MKALDWREKERRCKQIWEFILHRGQSNPSGKQKNKPKFFFFFTAKSQQEQQSGTIYQRHILNSWFLPASCLKGGTFNKLCYIWRSHLNSVISTCTMRANCACLCVHSSGRGSLMNCVPCNCKSSFILSVLCHVMQLPTHFSSYKIPSPSFFFSS